MQQIEVQKTELSSRIQILANLLQSLSHKSTWEGHETLVPLTMS